MKSRNRSVFLGTTSFPCPPTSSFHFILILQFLRTFFFLFSKMLKILNFLSAIFLVFLLIVSGIFGYNLDAKKGVVFRDPTAGQWRRESYFGYSVAIYPNAEDPMILIGAPRANVSRLIRIKEPGSVYYCRLNGVCKEWPVGGSGNGRIRGYNHIDQVLDGAWLGASISVEDKAEPRIVVCAPKWMNVIQRSRFMNGICYYTNVHSSSAFERSADQLITVLTKPYRQTQLDSNRVGYYYYGMGGLGFSLHEFSGEPIWDIMIGAPGTYAWTGTPVLISENQPEKLDAIIPEGLDEDIEYLGYSVTSGFFFDTQNRWYVASSPRTRDMKGRILIFQYDQNNYLKFIRTVSGTQTGEYFGASVASCDVDGDGKDEIIVGAPFWSDDGDEGRIYVVSARKNSNGFDMISINGKFEDARFGTTVVCLGDLDHDGYEDVAVGAPWEDKSGAVYIFNGGRHGLSSVASQKIRGKDIGRFKGFGLAISQPRDIDGNGYSDIVIGAYKSGNAVLFRAQPVIDMQINLAYVDSARLNSNTTTFSIRVCGFYDGYKVPAILRVIKSFKIDQTHHRAKLGHRMQSINGTYQMESVLQYRKKTCDDIPVILTRGTKTDPIEISASLSLINEESPTEFCSSCPKINKERSKLEDTIQLPFDVDCGSDNICHSNLTATIFTNLGINNSYTIGSEKIIKLFLNVRNYGEPAYQTQAHVILPESIGLASINTDCFENPMINGSSQVVCDIGNPLRDQNTMTLELDMSRVKSDSESYSETMNISVSLTTQSKNINIDRGIHNLSINLRADADVIIIGKAEDSAYSYLNTSEDKLEFIRFNHIYEVEKHGVTPIQQAALTILIPTHLLKNEEKIEIARINSTNFKFPDSVNNNNNNCGIQEVAGEEKMMIEDESSDVEELLDASLRERALLLNCRSQKIHCINVTCILDVPMGSGNSSAVAELKLTIDLQLKNFADDLMDSKDIIFFMTNGTVAITHPSPLSKNRVTKRNRTSIGTKFLGTPVASPVATWIIALSVLLGILLLVILIIVLIKLGFFNRKQKEELEALKAETDDKQGIVIETSSSRECLDRD